MATKNTVISADSHVLEPEDLWEKALVGRYEGHVPKLVQSFQGMEGRFFYLGARERRASGRDGRCK